MAEPYQAPERLRHVFEHFGVEPKETPEQLELLKDGSGFVYLIQCHEFVKIGIAENVEARCAYLQVGNPYELKLLKVFASRTPAADEERLQTGLARYHERGEWYTLPEPVLEALLNLEDLSMLHNARVRWSNGEETETRPFAEEVDDRPAQGRLPPRPRFVRFSVRLGGKCLYAGSVGRTLPSSPIYVRQTRSNHVPLADKDRVEAAIKVFLRQVVTTSGTYSIEYGKGAPTTPPTVQ